MNIWIVFGIALVVILVLNAFIVVLLDWSARRHLRRLERQMTSTPYDFRSGNVISPFRERTRDARRPARRSRGRSTLDREHARYGHRVLSVRPADRPDQGRLAASRACSAGSRRHIRFCAAHAARLKGTA